MVTFTEEILNGKLHFCAVNGGGPKKKKTFVPSKTFSEKTGLKSTKNELYVADKSA